MRLHKLLSTLVASALLFVGTAFAAGVAFDDANFDPFDEDEGYVDLFLDGDVLTFTFDEVEGSIPGTLEGDALPLDGDLDEDFLLRPDSLALYGGLPVGTTPTSVVMDLDGDGFAIHDAILARLDGLGLAYAEIYEGGPVRTYDVTHGEDTWLLSITPSGSHATVYLQATR